ncbi:MAG: hypothetical protein IT200_13150 [Thermoleophilia bacterium]|nr:hypothetical protein [Thermoleophilia bacterium]
MRWFPLIAAVAAVLPAGPAAAAHGGTMRHEALGVRAELSWPSATRVTPAGPLADHVALTVTRGADAPQRFPARALGLVSPVLLEPGALRVVDLDGDGTPEVVVTAFSYGAHCCYSGRIAWRPVAADRDRLVRIEWGDVAGELRDADGDGLPEFVGVDIRFAYGLGVSYADSAFPARVLRFRSGRLVDATAAYPAVVRRSMRRNWGSYRQGRREGRAVADALAAYLADASGLGVQAAAWSRVRSAEGARNPRMLRAIARTLHRWGYRTA